MDPADSDAIKHALASQGQLVTQHDKTLHKLMAAVQALSLSVTQIGSQLDHVTTHLTAPTASAEAAPLAAPVVQPAATQSPREPSVPTPERYAGDLGSFSSVL